MTSEELSYIAGFFDGEGSAYISLVKASKNGKRYPRLTAKIAQNDRVVLDWIAAGFGFGKVYGQKDSRTANTNHQIVFAYRQARRFLTSIEPYLRVKQRHVSSLLDEAGRDKADSSSG